jgi:hypothetical protein
VAFAFLIVARVRLVTGGSVYAVTEDLTESRPSSRSTLGGSPFPPIAEYGFLSDCQVSALIAASGTVEWMCLPRMDGPSVFAAILDRGAGWFRLGPADVTVPAGRRYLPGTMVLETTGPPRPAGPWSVTTGKQRSCWAPTSRNSG